MDEFAQAQQQLKGPGTSGWWDQVLPSLDVDRRKSLLDAASNRAISHRAICVVLERWGHPVTTAQVGHWRRNHVR